MRFWKSLISKLRQTLKYSVVDPSSFEEVWSFTSTRIRVFSLSLILIIGLGFGVSYLLSLFGGVGFVQKDKTIERAQLEKQYEKVDALQETVRIQEQYIAVLRRIWSDEVAVPNNLDSLKEMATIDYSQLDPTPSLPERKISKEVREDMRTTAGKESAIPYFKAPVFGVVSDKFEKKTHPGIDVVTNENASIKACLSGTVIYAGFTRKDGYIIIMDHGNGYMSIYKHARKSLKKAGDRVQIGDPIGIVGNTGENSDGPHLHFEIWYNQMPINPEDYLNFTR